MSFNPIRQKVCLGGLIAAALLIAILTLIPLFCPEGFYSLGEYKWLLYAVIYILWIPVALITLAVTGMIKRRSAAVAGNADTLASSAPDVPDIPGAANTVDTPTSPGATNSRSIQHISQIPRIARLDLAVLVYAVFCMISYFVSWDKQLALLGYDYFHMGLFTQLTMIIGYFAAKRGGYKVKIIWYAGIITAGAIFTLAAINRLGGDPFSFYEELEPREALTHLSTIGQHTWFSSYLSVLMPMSVAGYAFLNNKRARAIALIVMVSGFSATVTQNADSGYLSLIAYMVVLLWLSAGDDIAFQRFLEICAICVGTFSITGIFQLIFGPYIHEVDELSWFMSHSPLIYISCIGFTFLAVINKRKGGLFTSAQRQRLCRAITAILAGIIAAGVIYITLNTAGILPEAVSSNNGYLLFSDEWGNNRGVIWRAAIAGFMDLEPLNKAFGVGHDCFFIPAYNVMEMELVEYLPGNIVVNAHNEWLNTLVNMGVLGLISYGAIFVCSFTGNMSAAGSLSTTDGINDEIKAAIIKGTAMAIASYAAHNLFCYQLIVSTPILFIFMGMAGSLVSRFNHFK